MPKLKSNPQYLISFISSSSICAMSVIAILSLGVKLGYIVTLGGGVAAFPTEGSDAFFYNKAAVNIVESGVYGLSPSSPSAGMPPGEPVFLAFMYIVGGHSIAIAKFAHVALLTLVAIMTFLTARELVNVRVGFWAGVLIAIDPAQAYLAGTFLSDPLYIFFATLAIYLVVCRKSPKSWTLLVSAGVCLGLAGLTRNQGWLFSIAVGLGAVLTVGRLMPIRETGILVLATLLTIAPWTYRNFQVTGKFVPVSTEGGLTLWASNNPLFEFRPPMPMSLPIYVIPSDLSGYQVDEYYRQRALDWIVSHPVEFLINGMRKVFVLYDFDPQSWRSDVAGLYRLAGIFPYGILLPFILVGLFKNLRNEKFGVVLWYILFTTLLSFLFYGDSRIRAPIQPYLYIYGVLGLEFVLNWRRERRISEVLPEG